MRAVQVNRLSPARVALALAVLAAGSYLVVDRVQAAVSDDDPVAAPPDPTWFAPYVDVTLEPAVNWEDPAVAPVDDLVLSFVVADPEHPCRPAWGGAYGLGEAADVLALDRRIARVRQGGGDVVVAFGGAANQELAVACDDQSRLTRAYRDVVDRYDLGVIDLDVEGGALVDEEATARRAAALARVQAERADAGKPLEVWLTLPVDPSGLPEAAAAVLDATLAGGVELTGVNAMTMNYGEARGDRSMFDASLAALDAVHTQLADAFGRAGQRLTATEVWGRMGATPMLGQNDVVADRFELEAAEALVEAADDRGLARLSVWSLNRDTPCGPNDTGMASPLCSGTAAPALAFTRAFAVVDGRATEGAPAPLAPSTTGAVPVADDPAASPYPIWDERRPYAEGDRVVWHHNVYEAKWWTDGQAPDAPVAEAWETAWRLLGPVLPGDRPPPPVEVPDGTRRWLPDAVYHAGDLVQHDGIAYVARWWTQGDAPDLVPTDPNGSPWELLAPA